MAAGREHFDRWAPSYDRAVNDLARRDEYPFAGYDAVLDGICRASGAAPGVRVLDLGTGTGNLSRTLADQGCTVTGTDVSEGMLARARAKVPDAQFVLADLTAAWPPSLSGPYDIITSAYVLHHFDLAQKMSIVGEAAKRLVGGAEERGRIIVGDVAFATRSDLEATRHRVGDTWDDDEEYWVADETIDAARAAGLHATWQSMSFCAGVMTFAAIRAG